MTRADQVKRVRVVAPAQDPRKFAFEFLTKPSADRTANKRFGAQPVAPPISLCLQQNKFQTDSKEYAKYEAELAKKRQLMKQK